MSHVTKPKLSAACVNKACTKTWSMQEAIAFGQIWLCLCPVALQQVHKISAQRLVPQRQTHHYSAQIYQVPNEHIVGRKCVIPQSVRGGRKWCCLWSEQSSDGAVGGPASRALFDSTGRRVGISNALRFSVLVTRWGCFLHVYLVISFQIWLLCRDRFCHFQSPGGGAIRNLPIK